MKYIVAIPFEVSAGSPRDALANTSPPAGCNEISISVQQPIPEVATFLVTLFTEINSPSSEDAIKTAGHGSRIVGELKTVAAVPFDQWPIWAKGLKLIAIPTDKGIGDVIARKLGNENSEAFKAWYKTTFGKDCGCTGRQAKWNLMYPLKTNEQ